MLTRRRFLHHTAAGTAALLLPGCVRAATPATAPRRRLNIVFILADDLGYGDLGCFGNPIAQTPRLDQLAAEGQVLPQYYAAAPVCMPSRVALLTGRYPYRTGSRMSVESRPPALDETFLPRVLAEAGYATGVYGKWHLGHFPDGMDRFGFQDYGICAPGGWCDYYDYTLHRPDGNQPGNGRYSTDAITDEALAFIDRHHARPFFLYLAYTAPHFPLQAPPEDLAAFQHRPDLAPGAAIVYAMVKHLDACVGRVLDELERRQLADDTLVIFTSDNGPRFGAFEGLDQHRFNADLAGEKGYVLEGGIRVPAIVRWPQRCGSAPPTFPHLMHAVDWFATLLAAAEVPVPAGLDLDGADYRLALLGQTAPPSVRRFWSYNKVRPTPVSNAAYREGPWKLHRPAIEEFNQWGHPADLPLPEQIPDYQLFRIDTDPAERHDLGDEFPERRGRMIETFERWYEKTLREHRAKQP